MSPKSAGLAKKLGHKNVKVYSAGMPAWKKAGKASVVSVDTVKKFVDAASKTADKPPFFVLIDLRSGDDIAKGFIPFATAMSSEDVIQKVAQFPKFKKAPIVLYTNDGITPEALAALKQLRRWKYKSAAILDGGFPAWKKAGNKVASGAPAKKISFVKKVAKDEIPIAEFLEIVTKKPKDKLLVDVRNKDEFSAGSVPGAKNITLADLQKDVGMLPKDKEIITFCNTGAISSIADKVLKKKGIKSRYLNATINYEGGGKFKVEE